MLWQWVNTGSQIFILDLDGTLLPSAEIDNQCYWQAVFDCFGKHGSLPDLHDFRHVTDSGILAEWCARELGRPPRIAEISEIRQRFEELLDAAAGEQPRHFTPLPGVEDWLEAAAGRDDTGVAIATGGWGHSARLKLERSGLDRFGLPVASSDDDGERTGIMQIAAAQVVSSGALARQSSGRVVITYVGDGVWDLHASRALGWRFIGIASGARARQLRRAGADQVRPDFRPSPRPRV